MVDKGADLSPLSQYPGEKEVCWPPLTNLEVVGTSVRGQQLGKMPGVLCLWRERLGENVWGVQGVKDLRKSKSTSLDITDVVSECAIYLKD